MTLDAFLLTALAAVVALLLLSVVASVGVLTVRLIGDGVAAYKRSQERRSANRATFDRYYAQRSQSLTSAPVTSYAYPASRTTPPPPRPLRAAR